MSADQNKTPEPRKALGRGLSALIGSTSPSTTPNMPTTSVKQEVALPKSPTSPVNLPKGVRFEEVDLSKIDANPEQPRKHFNQAKLEELSLSLKERGLVQPIVVKNGQNGRFVIIAGERRYRAAKLAGFDKIPAIIRDEQFGALDQDLASLVENIQREELSPIELAVGYDRMIRHHNFTQENLAQKLGLSRVAVANTLRLLKLPEAVRNLVSQKILSEGHSRALLQLDNDEEMVRLANEIIETGMTVRDVEQKVRMRAQAVLESRISGSHRPGADAASAAGRNVEFLALEEEFRRLMGTKVTLRGNAAKGTIEIYFNGRDSLNRLVHQLRALQN